MNMQIQGKIHAAFDAEQVTHFGARRSSGPCREPPWRGELKEANVTTRNATEGDR